MLVKNTMTGKKIDKKTAYIVATESKNLFFDNEEQYYQYIKIKTLKANLEQKYVNTLSPYISFDRNSDLRTIVRRHIKNLLSNYDVEFVSAKLDQLKSSFDYAENRVNFNSMKSKYFYFFKIISNQCDLTYNKYLQEKQKQELQSKINVPVSDDCMAITSSVKNNKKKDITEFLED